MVIYIYLYSNILCTLWRINYWIELNWINMLEYIFMNTSSRYSKVSVSELLEKIEDMFTRYHMQSDVLWGSNIQLCNHALNPLKGLTCVGVWYETIIAGVVVWTHTIRGRRTSSIVITDNTISMTIKIHWKLNEIKLFTFYLEQTCHLYAHCVET